MYTSIAFAKFSYNVQKLNSTISQTSQNAFLFPNETSPIDNISNLRKLPRGVYLTVGTERGFISAANALNVDRLILADVSQAVNLYNLINILLIHSSNNKEDYLELRLNSDYQNWKAKLETISDLTPKEVDFFTTKEVYNWWDKTIRTPLWDSFHKDPIHQTEMNHHFKGMNYLFNDESYEKIRSLVLENRVEVYNIDWSNVDNMHELFDSFKTRNLIISSIDFSNAWYNSYIPKESVQSIISQSAELMAHKAQYLFTDVGEIESDLASSSKESFLTWNYYSFEVPETFNQTSSLKFTHKIFDQLVENDSVSEKMDLPCIKMLGRFQDSSF
jgi:hypothetical protein